MVKLQPASLQSRSPRLGKLQSPQIYTPGICSAFRSTANATEPEAKPWVSLLIHTITVRCCRFLGQSKDPAIIQAHLKKLFAGMHAVAISDNRSSITAALSVEDERVELAAPVAIDENVESWLSRLSAAMQTSSAGRAS